MWVVAAATADLRVRVQPEAHTVQAASERFHVFRVAQGRRRVQQGEVEYALGAVLDQRAVGLADRHAQEVLAGRCPDDEDCPGPD